MFAHGLDPLVKDAAKLADLLRVFRQRLLPPAIGRRAQQGDERGGAGRDDVVFVDLPVDQIGFEFEGRTKKAFARNKKHDELRRGLKLLPIRLHSEQLHMLADIPRVLRQLGAPLRFGRRFERLQIGFHGRLRIDDQAFASGQFHHYVGPQRAVFRGHVRLFEKIAVLEHSRQLDHPPKLQFTPATTHPRSSERLDQVGGLLLQRDLRLGQPAHLLRQATVGLDPRLLDLADLHVEFLQGFPHGLDQLVDGGLPLFEIVPGALLEFFQRGVGQVEKSRIVALQRLR